MKISMILEYPELESIEFSNILYTIEVTSKTNKKSDEYDEH